MYAIREARGLTRAKSDHQVLCRTESAYWTGTDWTDDSDRAATYDTFDQAVAVAACLTRLAAVVSWGEF